MTCGEIVPVRGINQPIQELFHRNFVFDAPPGNCIPVLPSKAGRSFPEGLDWESASRFERGFRDAFSARGLFGKPYPVSSQNSGPQFP